MQLEGAFFPFLHVFLILTCCRYPHLRMTQYLLKSFGKAQDVHIPYIPVNFHEKIMRPYKVVSEKQNNYL